MEMVLVLTLYNALGQVIPSGNRQVSSPTFADTVYILFQMEKQPNPVNLGKSTEFQQNYSQVSRWT